MFCAHDPPNMKLHVKVPSYFPGRQSLRDASVTGAESGCPFGGAASGGGTWTTAPSGRTLDGTMNTPTSPSAPVHESAADPKRYVASGANERIRGRRFASESRRVT